MSAAKRISFVAGLALTVTIVAAAASVAAPNSRSSSTINVTIGDVVPLTGPLASFGPSFYKAAQIAVAQANTAAKTAGVPLNAAKREGVSLDIRRRSVVEGNVEALKGWFKSPAGFGAGIW